MVNHFWKAGPHKNSLYYASEQNNEASPMKVVVNGQERLLPAPATLAALLEELGMAGKRVAVEVNQEIVPRSQHGQHRLADNDRIEVLFAIGGG